VPVQYAKTSGEVEIVTYVDVDGELYVSVGSDHTDRELESIDIPWSKQVCPSIVAPRFWRWRDVAEVWDETEIASEVSDSFGRMQPYQRASVREFMSPPEMVAGLERKLRRVVRPYLFWSGTVVSLASELEYGGRFTIRLHNPRLGWTIEHTYTSPILFAEIDTRDMEFVRRGVLPSSLADDERPASPAGR
jgi:hypothetical protein